MGAFQKFAKDKMATLLPSLKREMPPELVERAHDNYETWGQERMPDMDEREWLASEMVKLAWRERHPRIVASWKAYEENAIKAVKNPGAAYSYQINSKTKLTFRTKIKGGNRYLLIRLPSGRFLSYFDPRVIEGSLTYMGLNQMTRQWERQSSFGGHLCENLCQTIARDILAEMMLDAERRGFELVLTVHDEIVAEADEDRSLDELINVLSTNPPWAEGLPLAADGFKAQRYRK